MLPAPTYSRRFRSKKQKTHRVATRKLVCFEWGGKRFAIGIEHTQYILKDFTPYGTLENGFSLVRHDDEIITLIDLSHLFPDKPTIEPDNYLIVCNYNQQKVGLAVSRIPVILEATQNQFIDVPEIYQHCLHTQMIANLIQTPDGPPIFHLNPATVIEFEQQ